YSIDGVLLHKSEPIKGATETLRYLQQHKIPFILLTNGGGKSEEARVRELSEKLGVELDTSNFVQSHTPYQLLTEADLTQAMDPENLHESTILVLGSDASAARRIAQGYGFKSVVTPADILAACPQIFPFDPLSEFYAKQEILPLPKPVYDPHDARRRLEDCLKIDAILVFNDPRDWAVDIQLVMDLLLSQRGYLGTYSPKNGDPHSGGAAAAWQSDGQPALVFSNCDLLWSTGYHLPRFGQGAFRNALRAQFGAIVAQAGAEPYRMKDFTFGKPERSTYHYAQKVLMRHFQALWQTGEDRVEHAAPLQSVWMVGDNPESDIRGANMWIGKKEPDSGSHASEGPEWNACLVRTGVWDEKKMPRERLDPAAVPDTVQDDVKAAVNHAFEMEGWPARVD
ncbi:HAD-superfamily hydrolase, partial [Cryphonectria parasitica EP155]